MHAVKNDTHVYYCPAHLPSCYINGESDDPMVTVWVKNIYQDSKLQINKMASFSSFISKLSSQFSSHSVIKFLLKGLSRNCFIKVEHKTEKFDKLWKKS